MNPVYFNVSVYGTLFMREVKLTLNNTHCNCLLKPMGVPEHPPAGGRVGIDIVGELATEHREQAVGISDCAADPRRVGTVGDVELRGDQLPGQD